MARGIYGDGSLYYAANKKLWVQTIHYRLPNGESAIKSISAKTKQRLREKVSEFKNSLADEINNTKNITVEKWIKIWLDVYVKNNHKQKTYENYRDRLRYVYPYIGNRMLHTITSLELQYIFNDLRQKGGVKKQGLASVSIQCMRRYLKAAFECAIHNGYLVKNPVSGTKVAKEKNRKWL